MLITTAMKFTICIITAVFIAGGVMAQPDLLKDSKNLEPVSVKIEEVQYQKRNAIRVTAAPGAERAYETLAILNGTEFKNGTIELELAGSALPGVDSTFRGFIGLSFRLKKKDSIEYECFYLRPTNGRAEDQLRRNHAVQYISHPRFTWFKLRKEFPGVYESYADMEAATWTKVKIVVRGQYARLYINDASQPCLIVQKMLHPVSSGQLALWIGPGTDGYFRNLKVKPE